MEILLFGFWILLRNLAQKKHGRKHKKPLGLEGVWKTHVFSVNINSSSETIQGTAGWLQVCQGHGMAWVTAPCFVSAVLQVCNHFLH